MMRIASVPLVILMTACGAQSSLPQSSLPQPSPVPLQSTPVVVIASSRDVVLGERVEGTYGDGKTITPGEQQFFISMPASGNLTVSLTWDPAPEGTLLKLIVDDRVFSPVRPDWSPVVASVPVQAGNKYQIRVGLAGADWLPHDRFVLTTSLAQ